MTTSIDVPLGKVMLFISQQHNIASAVVPCPFTAVAFIRPASKRTVAVFLLKQHLVISDNYVSDMLSDAYI